MVVPVLLYYLLAKGTDYADGVAGTLNATNTPAIVGCMPELRNRNQIIPPMQP